MEQIKFEPEDLINNDQKSIRYFSDLRWNGKRLCPRCKYEEHYPIDSNRYSCKKCRYNFGEFTGTYLGKVKKKPSQITYLLYNFAAERPAYRIQSNLKCHLSTIQRIFRLFRHLIYEKSLEELQDFKSSMKNMGIDESIFDRELGKQCWNSFKEKPIFGIYKIHQSNMITFPISYKKYEEITSRDYIKGKRSIYYEKEDLAYIRVHMTNESKVISEIKLGRGNIYVDFEGFYDYLGNCIYNYKAIRKQYFYLYLKEIEFRFNHRFDYTVIFYELSKLLVKTFSNER